MKSILFAIFGGFFGILLARITKSPEVFFWTVPIGILLGYYFANPLWRFTKSIFKILKNTNFKQAK
ncbi:hypothetical protein ThvES_00018640 [Thiovulum sp. ES]|nr:hypothetical protein ThvES_00018640 [Thiovulum sp. ES]